MHSFVAGVTRTTQSYVMNCVTCLFNTRIVFNFLDGDLETLDGTWLLEPVSPYPSAPPNQVLMTHQVSVAPGSIISKSIFFDIDEDTLKATLAAIKEEVEQRNIN